MMTSRSRQIFQPRWYQQEAEQSVWDYFESGKTGNPVIALPTGTGKSVVIGNIVKRALREYPRTRIMKLTHVKELIDQNFKKLLDIWPTAPAGVYSAGLGRRDSNRPITYAGIASVAKSAKLFGHVDLVLVDEAHTVSAKDGTLYDQFLTDLWTQNNDLKVIGLTATPYRLGSGMITDGGIFTDVCYDLTTYEAFNRLIAEGFLCPLVAKRTDEELDVSGVKLSGGDYNLGDLQAAVDREAITRRAVQEMIRCGEGRNHWLVFASGVEHSDHVCEELELQGISAVSIHSKMTVENSPAWLVKQMRHNEEPRDTGLRLWKAGKITAAVNNNVLTTGIDFPAMDLIAVLRPTKSPGLWVQMLGRGTRVFEGKQNCLVLDFAGNTARLGPINDPVIPRKRGAKGSGGAPVKVCPVCMAYNHASVRFCVACNTEFVAAVKYRDSASTLEVLSISEPKFEDWPVTDVTYHEHKNKFHPEKPATLRVTYFSGTYRHVCEWLCFEHQGLPLHKSHEWWRARTQVPVPQTVQEALQQIRGFEFPRPKNIRVHVNSKRGKEVKLFDFNGTGFG